MEALLNKIESYGFECQGGPLASCIDWQKLRVAILLASQSEQAPPVEPPQAERSKDEELQAALKKVYRAGLKDGNYATPHGRDPESWIAPAEAEAIAEALLELQPTLICPRCNVDRFTADCPQREGCPMVGEPGADHE